MSKVINLTSVIYNRAGKPMVSRWIEEEKITDEETNVETIKEVKKERNLTLGVMIENALLNRNTQNMDETTISYNYSLFKKISGIEEIELEDDDIANIKRMICMVYDTMTAGQALELINK